MPTQDSDPTANNPADLTEERRPDAATPAVTNPGDGEGSDTPAVPSWVDLRRPLETPAPAAPEPRRAVNRALALTAALCAAAALAGTGFALGAQHTTLGPAVVRDTAGADRATWAQKVYAASSGSVVEILLPGGGAGSGFFYRPDRIVTNAHVVAGSGEALKAIGTGKTFTVTVRLADGRERKGTVLAVDSRTDLAVVEVPDGLGVRPLAFASSKGVTPGQPVAVLGHPFGGGASLSTGVVSALARNSSFASSDTQQLLLQTDAAVNPGNSGGPLLDATGAALGIVTLRPDTVDGRPTAGVAFALPADQVRRALTQLESTGKVTYPLLGVSLRTATADDTPKKGAVVQAVSAGSAASTAGVRKGDVITAVDGAAVASSAEVVDAVAAHRPGDGIRLVVVRAGKSAGLTATLAARP